MDPKNVQNILKNDHKWSFFNIIYTFLSGYNMIVTNMVFAMDPYNSVIKRLWCIASERAEPSIFIAGNDLEKLPLFYSCSGFRQTGFHVF